MLGSPRPGPVIATFAILNLFIVIIVSTMQELGTLPDLRFVDRELPEILDQMEADLRVLRARMEERESGSREGAAGDEPEPTENGESGTSAQEGR